MNRTIAYCTLICCFAASICVSVCKTEWLSDQNTFLKDFVNQQFLSILGVILAITLASAANIHLTFNRIEERYRAPGALTSSRANLRKAAGWLIGIFIFGIGLVVVKPIAAGTRVSEAIFNSVALVLLLWHVLILISLTQLVFRIEPDFPDMEDESPLSSQSQSAESVNPPSR